MHAWDEPADTLLAHAPSRDALVMPRLGEAVEPKEQRAAKPWWRQAGEAVEHSRNATDDARTDEAIKEKTLPWPLD
jgi:hypothetical protein